MSTVMAAEEDPQAAQRAKDLLAWRKSLATKRSVIPFFDEIRREIITCHKPEIFVDLMEKYLIRLEEHNNLPAVDKKASIIVAKNISQHLRHFHLRSINNLSEDYYSKVVQLLVIYTDMEIKYCFHLDATKATEVIYTECTNRIRQHFGLYLHKREENIVDVLLQSKKLHRGEKKLTEKILLEFTKPMSLPKDFGDEEYIKYLILFRNWKKSHWTDENHSRFIINRASMFMRPRSTLKSNTKYSFLPASTLDKATALYVETTAFSTNQLKLNDNETIPGINKFEDDPDCMIIEDIPLKTEIIAIPKPITGIVDLTSDNEDEDEITIDSVPGLAELIKSFDSVPAPVIPPRIDSNVICIDSDDESEPPPPPPPPEGGKEIVISQNLEELHIESESSEEPLPPPVITNDVEFELVEEEVTTSEPIEETIQEPTQEPEPIEEVIEPIEPVEPIQLIIEPMEEEVVVEEEVTVPKPVDEIIEDFASEEQNEIIEPEELVTKKSIGSVIFSAPSVKYNKQEVIETTIKEDSVVFSVFKNNKTVNSPAPLNYKKPISKSKTICFTDTNSSANKKGVKFSQASNEFDDESPDVTEFAQNRRKSTILEKISYVKNNTSAKDVQTLSGSTGKKNISSISQDKTLKTTIQHIDKESTSHEDEDEESEEEEPTAYYRLEKYKVFVNQHIFKDPRVFTSVLQLDVCKVNLPVKQPPSSVIIKSHSTVIKCDFDRWMDKFRQDQLNKQNKVTTRRKSIAVSRSDSIEDKQEAKKRSKSTVVKPVVIQTPNRIRTRSSQNYKNFVENLEKAEVEVEEKKKKITKRRMTVGTALIERRPSITTQVSEWITESSDKSPIKSSIAVVGLKDQEEEPTETNDETTENLMIKVLRNRHLSMATKILFKDQEEEPITNGVESTEVEVRTPKKKTVDEVKVNGTHVEEVVVGSRSSKRLKSVLLNRLECSERPEKEIVIQNSEIKVKSRSKVQTVQVEPMIEEEVHKTRSKSSKIVQNGLIEEPPVIEQPIIEKSPEKSLLIDVKTKLRTKHKISPPKVKPKAKRFKSPKKEVLINKNNEIKSEKKTKSVAEDVTTIPTTIVDSTSEPEPEQINENQTSETRGRSREKKRLELHNFHRDIRLDKNELRIYKNRSRSVIKNDNKVSKIVRRSSQIAFVRNTQIEEISKSKSMNSLGHFVDESEKIKPISNTVNAKIAKFMPDKETCAIANEQLMKIASTRTSTISTNKENERVKRRKSVFIESISPKRRNSSYKKAEEVEVELEKSFTNLRSNNIPVVLSSLPKRDKIVKKRKSPKKEIPFEQLNWNKFQSSSNLNQSFDSSIRKTQVNHKLLEKSVCTCSLSQHKSQLSYNLRTGGYFCKNALDDFKTSQHVPNDWNKSKNPYVRLNKVNVNNFESQNVIDLLLPTNGKISQQRRHTISISLGEGRCVFNENDCEHEECWKINQIHRFFSEKVTEPTLKRKKRLNSTNDKKIRKTTEVTQPTPTEVSSNNEAMLIIREEPFIDHSFSENKSENNFLQNVGSTVEITTFMTEFPEIETTNFHEEHEKSETELFPDTYDSEEVVEEDEEQQYFSESNFIDEQKEDSSSDSYYDPSNSSEYTEQNQLKIVFTKNLSDQYADNSTEITLMDHSYVPNEKYQDFIYDPYSLNPVQYVREEVVVNTDFDESNECLDPMNVSENFTESDDDSEKTKEIPSPPFDQETATIMENTPMDISAEETVVTFLDDPVDSFTTLQSSHIFLASTSSDENKIKYLHDDDEKLFSDEDCEELEEIYIPIEEDKRITDYQNLLESYPNETTDFNDQMTLGSCVEVNTQFNENSNQQTAKEEVIHPLSSFSHSYFPNIVNPPPHLPNLLNGNTIITQSGKKGKKNLNIEIESQISVKKGRGRPRKNSICGDLPIKRSPKKRGRKKKITSNDEDVYRPPGTSYKKNNNFYEFSRDEVSKPRKKGKEKTIYASETITNCSTSKVYKYGKTTSTATSVTATCSYPKIKKIVKSKKFKKSENDYYCTIKTYDRFSSPNDKKRIKSESPPLTVESAGKTYSKNNVIRTVFVPADIEKYIEEEAGTQNVPADLNQDDVYVDCLENSAQVYQEELVHHDR